MARPARGSTEPSGSQRVSSSPSGRVRLGLKLEPFRLGGAWSRKIWPQSCRRQTCRAREGVLRCSTSAIFDGCKACPGSEAFLSFAQIRHDGPEGSCRRIVPKITLLPAGTEQTVVFERAERVRGAVVLRTLDPSERQGGPFMAWRLSKLTSCWRLPTIGGHVVRETGLPRNLAAAKVNEVSRHTPSLGSPMVVMSLIHIFCSGARAQTAVDRRDSQWSLVSSPAWVRES